MKIVQLLVSLIEKALKSPNGQKAAVGLTAELVSVLKAHPDLFDALLKELPASYQKWAPILKSEEANVMEIADVVVQAIVANPQLIGDVIAAAGVAQ